MASSILGKRKYQTAMGYDNDYPDMQQTAEYPPNYHREKLSCFSGETSYDDIPDIPKFSKELFETADGLHQILLWFEEYNKIILRQQLLEKLREQGMS